ncbi:DUF2330 domain-containing protein [bacterium]|nr:DUF2330 domain-containing protein [bacterium]
MQEISQRRGRAGAAMPLLPLFLALAGAVPGDARADGGYVSPYGFPVWEPGQTAFLRHDATAGIEELSILPRFWGEPTDFAWLVPVPSLPEVTEADPELFRQLSALTAPVVRSRDSFWNCESRPDVLGGRGLGDGGVEIIDDEVIGIYRTQIVAATEADALTDSLTAWGFLHEGNRALVAPILAEYVADGWYFVAMSIDSTAAAAPRWPYGKAAPDRAAPDYWYPALQPMTFRFAAAQPIYPLRISQISAGGYSPVSLYVAADGRVDFPGARTLYANRLSVGEHAAITAAYPAAGAGLDAGRWLTRLYRAYAGAEMDADLVLTPAASQSPVRLVRYSGLPVWTVAFGGAVAWWVARRRR